MKKCLGSPVTQQRLFVPVFPTDLFDRPHLGFDSVIIILCPVHRVFHCAEFFELLRVVAK